MIYQFLIIFLLIICDSTYSSAPTSKSKTDTAVYNIALKIKSAQQQKQKFLQQHGDKKISSIQIKNNKKTNLTVIKRWLKNQPGNLLSQFNVTDLLENAYKSNLVSNVTILYQRDKGKGVIIHIVLKEKWSLYVFPIFYYLQDTILGGAFLVESNFLGYDIGVTMGGIGSNRGWQYLTGLIVPYFGATNFFGEIRHSAGSIYTENKNVQSELLQAFQQLRADLLYTLGYNLTQNFSIGHTFNFLLTDINPENNIDSPNKRIINIPNSTLLINIGIKLVYNNLRSRLYYNKGIRSSFEFKQGFNLRQEATDYFIYQILSENRYTLETFLDHTFSVASYLAYSNLPESVEHRLGGLEGSRTLPPILISADTYANLAIIYQVPIYNFKYGVFTLIGLFEGGFFMRNQDLLTPYYGPGFGFRFYFKYVTIPALGVDIAYELHTQGASAIDKLRISVAIGFRPNR